MEIGLGLPHLGHFADPAATRAAAIAAEDAGFASLWAMDRLLSPVAPRSLGYPGRADGVLPHVQERVLDPLVTLTLAAAVTDRVRLGTDVLVAPWYPPALLARSLAAIDQVSRGRLTVGLGLGWSIDEFEAVGAPIAGRGSRLEEVLDVLAALWAPGPTSISTAHETITGSVMGLKPVQRAGPPILLATFSPTGLDRIARRADGWLPFGLGLDELAETWGSLRIAARRHGRDPDELQLVVRADPTLTEVRLGSDRPSFTGSRDQVADDIDRARQIGATELILDLQTTACEVDQLIATALDLTADRPAALAVA